MRNYLKKIQVAACWNAALFILLSLIIMTSLDLHYASFKNLFFNAHEVTTANQIVRAKRNNIIYFRVFSEHSQAVTIDNGYYLIVTLDDQPIVIQTTKGIYERISDTEEPFEITGYFQPISTDLHYYIASHYNENIADFMLTSTFLNAISTRFIYVGASGLIFSFLYIAVMNILIIINPKRTKGLKNHPDLDTKITEINQLIDENDDVHLYDTMLIAKDNIVIVYDINILISKISNLKTIHCTKRGLLNLGKFTMTFYFTNGVMKLAANSEHEVIEYIKLIHRQNPDVYIRES